jgi:ATP-dependent DNA helicase PIF1
MWFSERAIITPLTSNVHRINDTIINDILPQDPNEWECLSADQVTDSHQALRVSVEFLNTIQISGLPTHKLRLRKHMPIMVLRNL